MALIQSCRLVCTARGHNKEYIVELHEDATEFRVDGRYGRIGATLTGARKYRGPSRYQAEAEYEKVRREKLNKGYEEVPLRNSLLFPDLPVPPTTRQRRAPAPAPEPTIDFYDDAPRKINL